MEVVFSASLPTSFYAKVLDDLSRPFCTLCQAPWCYLGGRSFNVDACPLCKLAYKFQTELPPRLTDETSLRWCMAVSMLDLYLRNPRANPSLWQRIVNKIDTFRR